MKNTPKKLDITNNLSILSAILQNRMVLKPNSDRATSAQMAKYAAYSSCCFVTIVLLKVSFYNLFLENNFKKTTHKIRFSMLYSININP